MLITGHQITTGLPRADAYTPRNPKMVAKQAINVFNTPRGQPGGQAIRSASLYRSPMTEWRGTASRRIKKATRPQMPENNRNIAVSVRIHRGTRVQRKEGIAQTISMRLSSSRDFGDDRAIPQVTASK